MLRRQSAGRAARSDSRITLPDGISDGLLRFVQLCQVAVLSCAADDYVAQVVSIWNCLAMFPRPAREADQLAASMAVSRIARGFFAAERRFQCADPATGAPVRRCHVNRLLQFVRERYSDPDLTLGLAASHLGLSVPFLSRALNAETGPVFGSPFRSHLNGIRVLAAIERLREPIPFHAIAKDVGYRNTGELDRQCARWFDLAPRDLRRFLTQDPTVQVEQWGVTESRSQATL
jgi:AraC-like DNA-binding protein